MKFTKRLRPQATAQRASARPAGGGQGTARPLPFLGRGMSSFTRGRRVRLPAPAADDRHDRSSHVAPSDAHIIRNLAKPFLWPNPFCCNSSDLPRTAPFTTPSRVLCTRKGSPSDRTGAPDTHRQPLHGPHSSRACRKLSPPDPRYLTASAAKDRASGTRVRFGRVMRQGCKECGSLAVATGSG